MSKAARVLAFLLVVLPFVLGRRGVVIAAEDSRAACMAACNERCQPGCSGSGGECRYECQKDCPSSATSTTAPPPAPSGAPEDEDTAPAYDAGATDASTRD